jgi:hypothetical protein
LDRSRASATSVDLGDLDERLVDDVDRCRRILLHPGEDLQTPSPAVPAKRVGAVRDVLKLVEDELRDDERPIHEPGFDDLRNPSVDDRARVDDDVRIARGSRPIRVGNRPTDDPDRLGRKEQVVAFRDREAEHPEAEEERDAERQPCPERRRERCERQPQQEAHQQSDQQANDGRHELRGRQLLDLAHEPHGRHDGEIREDREADDHPGDDPGAEQPTARGRLVEEPRRGCQGEADEATQGGPEEPDVADHVALASSLSGRARPPPPIALNRPYLSIGLIRRGRAPAAPGLPTGRPRSPRAGCRRQRSRSR